MPRFTKKELADLIEETEATGNDATELKELLREVSGDESQQPRQPLARRGGSRVAGEEETTEERLTRRVGDLFPDGIPFQEIYDYDYRFTQKELVEQCRRAGLGVSGDKKELAAKLLACGLVEKTQEEEKMEPTEGVDYVDLKRQREWEGKPGTVAVLEAYTKDLRYEIVVFARKERGGSDFTFRCREYQQIKEGAWRFIGVMQDTSKHDQDKVELERYSYHPEVVLVNVAFMVYPKPEDVET